MPGDECLRGVVALVEIDGADERLERVREEHAARAAVSFASPRESSR